MKPYSSMEAMWADLVRNMPGVENLNPDTLAIRKAFFMMGGNAYAVVQRKLAVDNKHLPAEEGMLLLKRMHEECEASTDAAIMALPRGDNAPDEQGD